MWQGLAGVSAAGLGLAGLLDCRRSMRAARARLDEVERRSITTPMGRVEFAEAGTGPPLLVSHGIFHGADGGLRSMRDLVSDRRVIAPSRFGYLGSSMPGGATPALQADAFAALLDRLEVDVVDVVAISAGTGAAAQLATRHPHRVSRLIVSSGNFPGSPTADPVPAWGIALYNDPAMWALRRLARPFFARLMGVPDGFPRTPEERAFIEEMLDSVFPIEPRAEGARFDATRSNPDITSTPLERITVPTMIIHARDDPLASFDAAASAARRVPRAQLIPLESGGHLQLGQTVTVRAALDAFLAAPRVRDAL